MRDALLDAAFEALLDAGPGFALSDVAARAGASKALVFHHFATREGLLDAMAARVLSETQEGLTRLAEEQPHPRDRLDALARTLLEEPVEPPERARHVLQFWLDGGRARLRDDLLADFVRATLREGVAVGVVRQTADADRVVATLLLRWHGATVLHATGRALDFEREAERLVEDVGALVAR